MSFPKQEVGASRFEVGKVVGTHQEGNVTIRKHESGSFTALVDGRPEPARQYLLRIRDSMNLPDKINNTTRSLGAQVFGQLGK
jgi:hypothetical protein